jgi:hypothetical protein
MVEGGIGSVEEPEDVENTCPHCELAILERADEVVIVIVLSLKRQRPELRSACGNFSLMISAWRNQDRR